MSVGFAVSLVQDVLFLRRLQFAQLPLLPVTLRGFCIFSAYVCLPTCCAGGVGWGNRPSLPFLVPLLRRLACR